MNAIVKRLSGKLNNKRSGKKGFTLMEMLIVVAIIAILVAVAIPTFNNALSSARKATDDANIRAAYAQYQVNQMMSAADGKGDIKAQASIADAKAAFAEIGVSSLQHYEKVKIPTNGRWEGTGSGKADVKTDGAFILE